MKQQVARLSPHQNGKVFGVLMALSSLFIVVPMFFMFSATMPTGAGGPPAAMILAMPVLYLLFGYASVAVGCAVYNFMFKFIGGIEFVTQADQSGDA